ncbi:alpha/beta fold hydrolase [Pinisolibacter aquiterrae]|uniref:alpha/beta fold hydrolase n=1 Tax=Pinisolibacter aquiterrae TaxID=2815579 RepID=UPI001C3D341A|nr:alpha/beta hydrolase [Pinisolibacter aquiterrae]MCC8233729.1 alpha/beta hydrolase [Pinisolibacter aquiterrae]
MTDDSPSLPLAGPTGAAFGPTSRDASGTPYRPFRFFARDGVVLAGRDYAPSRPTDRRPVVCLPGLTRNSRDFEPAVARLTAGTGGSPARRCVTFDFRGRGASERSHPSLYTPLQELDDTRLGLAALGIETITAFGTSRGGIVTMLAGLVAPGLVATAVLNDIGAVIELAGLLRIKGYVGRSLPEGIDWPTLITVVSQANRDEFPRLDAVAWERHARRLFRDVEGRPAMDYDPEIARTLDAVTAETPMPDLWAAFDTLTEIPILSVRGALSDLLTEETVAAMAARAPRLETLIVADQGHAPLFDDDLSLDGLVAFLDRVGA